MKSSFRLAHPVMMMLLLLFFFSACDPARVLIVKASKKSNASLVIYANNNILPSAQENQPGKLLIEMPVKVSPMKFESKYYYGIGGWSDDLIADFAANTDSIIIFNGKETTRFVNYEQINQYLIKHRGGIAKHNLKIEAK